MIFGIGRELLSKTERLESENADLRNSVVQLEHRLSLAVSAARRWERMYLVERAKVIESDIVSHGCIRSGETVPVENVLLPGGGFPNREAFLSDGFADASGTFSREYRPE